MRRLSQANIETNTNKNTRSWLMVAAGAITAFYFGTVLALASFDWGLIIPLIAGICLVAAGLVKLWWPDLILPSKYRLIKKIGCCLLVIWLLSFIVIEGLIIQSALAADVTRADYVLVLGAGIRGEQIPPLLEKRLDCALEYLKTYPDSQTILSGGQGRGETISEAEAMKRYLLKRGIAESRIIVEDQATSTFENIKYTQSILNQKGAVKNARLIIISNDFHLFRATMLARELGLYASRLACRTALIDIPHCYIREYFAVIKSLVIDKV